MKKTIILWLAAMCWFAGSSFGRDTIYEAENAALLDGIQVIEGTSASGGKFLRMEETGAVRFGVNVEQAGRYTLTIGYRVSGGDTAQRILINGTEYAPEIGFPLQAGWSQIQYSAGLKAGANTIELRKSWGRMDIDSLTVSGPIFEQPEISPKTNTFYQNQTVSDLFIQVEKKQHPLISITHNDKPVPFDQTPVSYIQDAAMVKISADYLATLDTGKTELVFHFGDCEPLPFSLDVRNTQRQAELTIVSFDVSHGASVLILFPTGKSLLIDTGTETMCKERVIPFLQRHHINLDYLWLTHYHDDHAGGQKLLAETFKDLAKKDYRGFTSGERFEFEKTNITILNAYQDGTDENTRSLSMRMEYKGFVYTHGGDIYGQNQDRILRRYTAENQPDFLRTHVYHANHHFHGSVDVPYLRTIDPRLFIVSAEEHVYGRGAYTHHVQREVLPWLNENGRLLEDLLSFEVGHVVIRITDGDVWNYETYKDLDALIPGLSRSEKNGS